MNHRRVTYKEEVDSLARRAADTLVRRGVPRAAVDFDAPHRRGRRPGDARSEFLGNRAMGDWAEQMVQTGLNDLNMGVRFIKYGNADDIVAGDPDFCKFYDVYQEELASTGKRPDLLMIDQKDVDPMWEDDVSLQPASRLAEITAKAEAAIEVRSSKFMALKYAEQREQQVREHPKAKVRLCQSFTPKLEDLGVVKRWIGSFGVLHYYLQVFFDCAYIISLVNILTIIADRPESYDVEKNRNNQEKPTIHIPVSEGTKIAVFRELPEFRAEVRETNLHRLDAYVVPVGGLIHIDATAFRKALDLS